MSFFDEIWRALNHAGGESPADAQLNEQGSLMGSAKAEPRADAAAQGPALSTLTDIINKLNPMDWMGGFGGSAAAHVPGTYRAIGLERSGASGSLNPAQYLAKLQLQPNFERFQQLVQMLTRQGLGESFPVARGASQIDPLVTAIQQGLPTPVTAVSHNILDPAITKRIPGGDMLPPGVSPTAEEFARSIAQNSRKPAYIAQGTATPKDVAAFVPRRNQYNNEAELILKPTENFKPELTAKYIPPSKDYPWAERKSLDPIEEYVKSILQALGRAAEPPPR